MALAFSKVIPSHFCLAFSALFLFFFPPRPPSSCLTFSSWKLYFPNWPFRALDTEGDLPLEQCIRSHPVFRVMSFRRAFARPLFELIPPPKSTLAIFSPSLPKCLACPRIAKEKCPRLSLHLLMSPFQRSSIFSIHPLVVVQLLLMFFSFFPHRCTPPRFLLIPISPPLDYFLTAPRELPSRALPSIMRRRRIFMIFLFEISFQTFCYPVSMKRLPPVNTHFSFLLLWKEFLSLPTPGRRFRLPVHGAEPESSKWVGWSCLLME